MFTNTLHYFAILLLLFAKFTDESVLRSLKKVAVKVIGLPLLIIKRTTPYDEQATPSPTRATYNMWDIFDYDSVRKMQNAWIYANKEPLTYTSSKKMTTTLNFDDIHPMSKLFPRQIEYNASTYCYRDSFMLQAIYNDTAFEGKGWIKLPDFYSTFIARCEWSDIKALVNVSFDESSVTLAEYLAHSFQVNLTNGKELPEHSWYLIQSEFETRIKKTLLEYARPLIHTLYNSTNAFRGTVTYFNRYRENYERNVRKLIGHPTPKMYQGHFRFLKIGNIGWLVLQYVHRFKTTFSILFSTDLEFRVKMEGEENYTYHTLYDLTVTGTLQDKITELHYGGEQLPEDKTHLVLQYLNEMYFDEDDVGEGFI